MKFVITVSDKAMQMLQKLERDRSLAKRFRAVQKALTYLRDNPQHPSLYTHKFSAFVGKNGEEMFEAYAENHTPGAYRVFWHYGPGKGEITIFDITPHP